VHINRVLREIRLAGLMTFQQGRVTFDDYAGLVDFANFDRGYLDHGDPLSADERQAPLAADRLQTTRPDHVDKFRGQSRPQAD
jgi:hypothetical protein